jgi:TRAP transporter TAXI family solute receptor
MLRRQFLAVLASASAAPWARADESKPRLVLATATLGGGFQVYGAALIAAIRTASPTLEIEERPTGGSAGNIDLLRQGSVDVALVQGEIAYAALATQSSGEPQLTAVAPMYPTPGLLAVTQLSPIRRLQDVRGHAIVLGTKSSGLTVMGRAVLHAAGIDPERDIQPILLERAADGPAMVLDGRAAGLWGGGIGWPGFVTLAQSPSGARFIGPDSQTVERVLVEQPSLRRVTVPAGTYQGQADAIDTVGSWSMILAKPGLAESAAYELIRAIDRARPDLAQRLPQGRDSDPRHLAQATQAQWVHPGAMRYLREIGTDSGTRLD